MALPYRGNNDLINILLQNLDMHNLGLHWFCKIIIFYPLTAA